MIQNTAIVAKIRIYDKWLENQKSDRKYTNNGSKKPTIFENFCEDS